MGKKIKRRHAGEVVVRRWGSGFLGTTDDGFDVVRIPARGEEGYQRADQYCILCHQPECQEWADVEVVAGPNAGKILCHLSDCQLRDLTHKVANRVINELLQECKPHRINEGAADETADL